jgi:hypothetical protein
MVRYRDYEYSELDAGYGEGWDEYGDFGDEPLARRVPAGEVIRGVLRADLADANPDDLNDALAEMLDSMSTAEGFNFGQALQQIGSGAVKTLQDPTVNSVLRTAVPLVAGAAGAYFGGAGGAQVGSNLGNLLVNALPGPPQARPPGTPTIPPAAVPGVPTAGMPMQMATTGMPMPMQMPTTGMPTPMQMPTTGMPTQIPTTGMPTQMPSPTPGLGLPALVPPALAGGSAAAAQGLVLTQQPDVLKALLSLAIGQAGKPSINGVPVPQIMNLLSDVFGRAAAHADELMYAASEGAGGYGEGEAVDRVGAGDSAQLYITLMDANAMELAEAMAGEEW